MRICYQRADGLWFWHPVDFIRNMKEAEASMYFLAQQSDIILVRLVQVITEHEKLENTYNNK